MKSTASFLLLAMSVSVGCEQPEDEGSSEEAARSAIPAAEDLKIDMRSGGSAKPAVGDVSGGYLVTLTTAVGLNGGVGLLLGTVGLIVHFPVTSIDGDTYVWGPWHDDGKPGEYKLSVTAKGGGEYAWTLDGRLFAQGGEWVTVVSGLSHPRRLRGGEGSFTADFELAKTLDPTSTAEGSIDVAYDTTGSPRTLTIDAENKKNQAFHYEYQQNADLSGELRFMAFGDTDDPGTAEETIQWHSRWKATGAGRADAQISGGDLGNTTVSMSDCWNEWPLFRSVYLSGSVAWIPTQGAASACAYP